MSTLLHQEDTIDYTTKIILVAFQLQAKEWKTNSILKTAKMLNLYSYWDTDLETDFLWDNHLPDLKMWAVRISSLQLTFANTRKEKNTSKWHIKV